jgi:hypothetical protein
MSRYPRRNMAGLLLIAVGILLLIVAGFSHVRRLGLAATLLMATGALMLARKV